MRSFRLAARETLEIVIISLVTVFIIRSFIIQPFLVNGSSMEPTFSNGNYLLIDEVSYYFRSPDRGEVVVFRYPNDQSVYFIKRIVGLPGDRIVIRNNQIFINDKELQEDYLPSLTRTDGRVDVQVGENEYFVLGDNRSYSFDSRNWGSVNKENLIGMARLRVFPFNKMKVFNYE